MIEKSLITEKQCLHYIETPPDIIGINIGTPIAGLSVLTETPQIEQYIQRIDTPDKMFPMEIQSSDEAHQIQLLSLGFETRPKDKELSTF